MAKYKITYNEGNHINITETMEADNIRDAVVVFLQEHPNAVFEKAEVVKD